MNTSTQIDYGPLTELIGIWKGNKGTDIAPDPDGSENNPYYETITFNPVGDVTNAESQILAVLRYHQVVQRQSNNEVFHDETGYWTWDAREKTIIHSFTIPRGISVLAGGIYNNEKDDQGRTIINVSAAIDDESWQIIQSPFMQKNAKTIKFTHHVAVGNGELSYFETTIIDIYGKIFEHTDQNQLIRQ